MFIIILLYVGLISIHTINASAYVGLNIIIAQHDVMTIAKNKVPFSLNYSNQLYTGNINIRGSSSLYFKKKGYSLSFQNKIALFDLPSHKKWILNGPIIDHSYIRNVLVYGMSREMGNYAPRTKFVHIYITQGNLKQYIGLYVLTEKIKEGKNRIPSPEYIFEINKRADILTNSSTRIELSYPDIEDISSSSLYDITNYFNKAETNIVNYMDLNSTIDYFLLTELTFNYDSYMRSVVFWMPSGTNNLKFIPWDYNNALGNRLPNIYKGWMLFNPVQNNSRGVTAVKWFQEMFHNPAFRNQAVVRWHTLRKKELNIQSIYNLTNHLYSEIHNEIDDDVKKYYKSSTSLYDMGVILLHIGLSISIISCIMAYQIQYYKCSYIIFGLFIQYISIVLLVIFINGNNSTLINLNIYPIYVLVFFIGISIFSCMLYSHTKKNPELRIINCLHIIYHTLLIILFIMCFILWHYPLIDKIKKNIYIPESIGDSIQNIVRRDLVDEVNTLTSFIQRRMLWIDEHI